MTSTENTAVDVLDVEQDTEQDVVVEADLDAEVVSDVVEAEPTPAKRRTRKPKGEADAQDVPAPAPVQEKSSFTRAKAVKHTEKMRTGATDLAGLFTEAFNGRIWLALEYPTFGDYLNAELGELRPRLPKAQRLELVAAMKETTKASQSAIAEMLGVDQKTVSNDLRELRGGSDATETSVGQDGVERASGDRSARRKPLEDRVSTVFDRLDKAFGDLTELTVEEGWDEAVSAVASRHRADVAKMIAQLKDLAQQFEEAPDFEGGEA